MILLSLPSLRVGLQVHTETHSVFDVGAMGLNSDTYICTVSAQPTESRFQSFLNTFGQSPYLKLSGTRQITENDFEILSTMLSLFNGGD